MMNLTTNGLVSPRGGGEVSESLVSQPLSESLLCLFTAATVTGSWVGGVDKHTHTQKKGKVKREATETAGGCCSAEVIDLSH